MKLSSLLHEHKLHSYHNNKKEKCLNLGRLVFFSSILFLSFLFSFFLLYPPNPFKNMDQIIFNQIPKVDENSIKAIQEKQSMITLEKQSFKNQPMANGCLPIKKTTEEQNSNKPPKVDENIKRTVQEEQTLITQENQNANQPQNDDCDLFNGQWIPDPKGSSYTNFSCPTIPSSKNCFFHGRKDKDFLNWRWKPDQCDLPKFNSKTFFNIVQGKKMAFIGDSVARNHMESLLCLLSQEEIPTDVYKDSEDRNRIWYFPIHNFTLSTYWTKFLVAGEQRTNNNSSSPEVYDLNINKLDNRWSTDLHTIDFAIISSAHWFFRPIYIHKDNETIGCIFCNSPNITSLDPAIAIKLIFEATFKHINNCKNCKENMVTVLRTFSPAHFENGTWSDGGACKRTRPYRATEIGWENSSDAIIGRFQVEELGKAGKIGDKLGKKFRVLDVTRAMQMRPDGHPNSYWGNEWMKSFNDCVHWCLPGPIDVWNDFLMTILSKIP